MPPYCIQNHTPISHHHLGYVHHLACEQHQPNNTKCRPYIPNPTLFFFFEQDKKKHKRQREVFLCVNVGIIISKSPTQTQHNAAAPEQRYRNCELQQTRPDRTGPDPYRTKPNRTRPMSDQTKTLIDSQSQRHTTTAAKPGSINQPVCVCLPFVVDNENKNKNRSGFSTLARKIPRNFSPSPPPSSPPRTGRGSGSEGRQAPRRETAYLAHQNIQGKENSQYSTKKAVTYHARFFGFTSNQLVYLFIRHSSNEEKKYSSPLRDRGA